MKPYHREDFARIRDFLVDTYAHFQRPYNWMIERWNFSISMARVMNGIPLEVWESQIAIWEHERAIVGMVNAEGEGDGEAFLQLVHEDMPNDVLREMFAFCESRLGKEENGKRVVYLRIPVGNLRIEQMASNRRYTQLPARESVSELDVKSGFSVELPPGFSFAYGSDVPNEEKAKAHARAFGYYDQAIYRDRTPIAYREVLKTPDYRADLDLYAVSLDGDIAAFATMWYDERNRVGILEPVGTNPRYRRLGLGRASIMQLANQVLREGGTKVYVGSAQDFYQRIGFRASDLYGVWGPKKFMGREYEGVHRTTFLIDKKGVIKQVFEKVKPDIHSEEILAALEA